MKLIWTFSIFILAFATAIYYQQEHLTPYMRSIFRPATFSRISSNLSVNTNRTLSSMSPSSTFVGLPVIPPQDPSLNAAAPKPRGIQKVFEAVEQSEGAGARVRRSIGTPKLRNFTPFLMLDHFNVGVGAGFPDHPHRSVPSLSEFSYDEHLLTIPSTEAKKPSHTSSPAPSTTRTSPAIRAPSSPATCNS